MVEAEAISLHALRVRNPDVYARGIGEIRNALLDNVDRSSLRQTAREVGMSPTGLSNFLFGAEPYLPTLAKLGKWLPHARGASRPAGD
jgi:hypothetical protein